MDDTIFAVASPPGGAERAVVRLSGDGVRGALAELLDVEVPRLRGAREGRLRVEGGSLPVRLLWMPAPHSYTAEDVAELHVPGAEPLVELVLGALAACGLRTAHPGEFTRRAYEHGRIDLNEATAVAALIGAHGAGERRAAFELLSGGLTRAAQDLGDELEALCSLCEASLDFDEADTGHVPTADLDAGAERVREALAVLAARIHARPLRAEPLVVLVGEPNVGKSSLWNRLVAGGRALASPARGTTRDVLEGRWVLAEGAVRLADLPGFEAEGEPTGAAAEAWRLARERLAGADLYLELRDACAPRPLPTELEDLLDPDVPRVRSSARCDLAAGEDRDGLRVSSATGEGLDDLAQAVASALFGTGSDAGGFGLSRELAARYRTALASAARHVDQARTGLAGGRALDLVAESLRTALADMAPLTGRRVPEDLLDRIFASFCIGK